MKRRLPAVYTYTLQCDAAQYQASTTITCTNSSPQITLTAPTTTWVANYSYSLFWSSDTTPCTQSGGAPRDGCAGLIKRDRPPRR